MADSKGSSKSGAAPRAAVIGSGFGGLAAAIRLQTAGIATTIFEARDKPGGRAYVYERDGFIFDGGPTVITAPHCLEELFTEAGRKLADYVTLVPVNPFYRLVWSDGQQFNYVGDSDAMIAQIRARNPGDVAGYRKFVEYSKAVFDTGYTELVHQPFCRFSDMVKVGPKLVGLRADRSVYAAVARHIDDEHIRQALSFHSLLVGGNPFETSAIYTLIHYLERKWGVFFPLGGTGALIRALVQLFQELGGQLRLSSPVKRIDSPAGNRPRHYVMCDGHADVFDLVVSNADVHHTYARLFRGHPSAARTVARLERMAWSMSLFVLYFGTDRPYRDEVVHHTVVFGPRYKELLRDIFHGASLPDDFSLYLHAPTHTDPSLAPPGCGTFYVLSPVPHLGNARIDWARVGPKYADRIIHELSRLMPDLPDHIVTRHFIDPTHFQTDLRSYHGSAFSCAPTLTQSAYFRPHNRDADIPGLYLVGAGTHPGAGVPGVVNSAKATAGLVLEDLGR